MKYERVIQYVLENPWAIRPAALGAILDILADRAHGEPFSDREMAEQFKAAEAARRAPRQSGAVAIIPIWGSIFPRANLFTEMSGGTSLQRFGSALAEADRDSQVGSIVLDVSSPGGLVDLVPETAEQIRNTTKPVTAVANTEAASAAYWLAAQADELVVTPSGQVGSIGVWSAHEDWSRFDDKLGVTTTLISAGRFKTEGNPFEPLGDEARAAFQKMIDTYYDMFVTDVARGRRTSVASVRAGFGEGRMVTAENAVTEGMADRVATLNQVISELAGASQSRPLTAAAVPAVEPAAAAPESDLYEALLKHL
jgi:signal peptide peptidase SppA